MAACLPRFLIELVCEKIDLRALRLFIVLRLCLVVMKWILLFSFYVCISYFPYIIVYVCTIFILNK